MYREHKDFEVPENENTKIWRYMDFTKFISLLETKSLFFARSDKFEDPYEGRLNQVTIDFFKLQFNKGIPSDQSDLAFESFMKEVEESRKVATINCWHMNEVESDAMWKLYLKNNEGIAIQSTFKRLCEAFSLTDSEINIGKVIYEDFNNYIFPLRGNLTANFLVKRKSFEHEKEIRAIHWRVSRQFGWRNLGEGKFPIVDYGENIPVDISTLIEKVYIAPNSPSWIKDLVKSMLTRYDLDSIPVKQSSLGSNIVEIRKTENYLM
ncbi:DUF2971 domain-containing protein [Niallia oryzisoli]|uniref:DUF2971 domain-containing protein n=1 Tax=Niallia oryzisoli TaxID=1737571 RepID=A0ABZ2CIB2_9BACI